MEDFYIECKSEEESKLCEKWAVNNSLSSKNVCFEYTKEWCYFIVENNEYTLNDAETYNLPEKTLSDLGINTTTEKDWSKVSKEELLEEAKRRYPVGSKFKCLVTKDEYIIPRNTTFQVASSSSIFSYVNNAVYHQHFNAESNKWAETILTPEVKETISDSKFIIGKWYCNSEKTYAKVDSIIDATTFRYKECIYDGFYEEYCSFWGDNLRMREASLEEIQQYLPEGHIDKIYNTPNSKFEVGDIVDTNNNGWQFCDVECTNAMEYRPASRFSNKLITHKVYSETHKNWWYKLNDLGNWYSECALEKHVDKVSSNPVTTSPESKPAQSKYNLSTTITRAVKNNDPSIIIRESGKSIDELCDLVDKKTTSCLTEGDNINCSGLTCNTDNCPFSQLNGKTKESAKAWLRSKSKQLLSDYEAVHVDSQEKWDYVSEKLGYTSSWGSSSKWGRYKKDSCINIEEVGFGTEGIAYSKVISFEDWVDLTGYRSEWFKPKKGNDLDIDKLALKNPLIPEECVKEKPEFSLFPNFVSKIN